MANEGHVIVKGKGELNYRDFYGPLDKGAARPSFCYPGRKAILEGEIRSLAKVLKSGEMDDAKKMGLEMDLKRHEDRLDKINEQEEKAKKLFSDNSDEWMKRRKELAAEIRAATPSRTDVQKRRVNPHRVLKQEKEGLQDKKTEYMVISRIAGEESNVTFLQKD